MTQNKFKRVPLTKEGIARYRGRLESLGYRTNYSRSIGLARSQRLGNGILNERHKFL